MVDPDIPQLTISSLNIHISSDECCLGKPAAMVAASSLQSIGSMKLVVFCNILVSKYTGSMHRMCTVSSSLSYSPTTKFEMFFLCSQVSWNYLRVFSFIISFVGKRFI